MRMTQLLKNKEGKWSILKIVISSLIGAVVATLVGFSVNTSYNRYAWMRDQCYKVATNENLLSEVRKNLDKKDADLEKKNESQDEEIDQLKAVVHGRLSAETDKREAQDQYLLSLIIKILEHQQKQVEIQQKGLEKQEEFIMEQRAK